MRFVRYKTTVTKVSDHKLTDIDDVKKLIYLLKDKEINCTMSLQEGPTYMVTRIKTADEGLFTFDIHKPNGILLHKSASYDELTYLEINTEDDKLVLGKPNMSRWFLLGHVNESYFDEV